MADIDLLLEGEKRNMLNDTQKEILTEARRRGLAPQIQGASDMSAMAQTERALPSTLQSAFKAAAAPVLPFNRPELTPLATPQARGVGQGAIQGVTLGYGMPALRKVIPGSEQIPQPTTKEELVGAGLSLPVGGVGLGSLAAKAGKLAPLVPAAIGYAANPSNTKIEPIGSPKRALGAGLGLVGQAIGGLVQKVAGYINPEAVTALTKALKPGKFNKNFQDDAALALPEIKKAGVEVNNLEDFNNAATQAKTNVWQKIQDYLDKSSGQQQTEIKAIPTGRIVSAQNPQPLPNEVFEPKGLGSPSGRLDEWDIQKLKDIRLTRSPEYKNIEILRNGIDGDEISEKMREVIKPESIKLTPEIGQAIDNATQKYEGQQITIKEAENRLQTINADLTSYFKASNRSGYVKGMQEDVSSMLAERKVLRQTLYDKIQSLTGKDIAPLKKQYGALMNVQDEALGRVNVANRQKPVSLQEAINGVMGLTDLFGGNPLGLVRIAGSQGVKFLNSPNRLVSQAVQNVGKSALPYNRVIPAAGVVAGRELESQ